MDSNDQSVLTIEQIIKDCKLFYSDTKNENGEYYIQILFPDYFKNINPDIKRYIIKLILNIATKY